MLKYIPNIMLCRYFFTIGILASALVPLSTNAEVRTIVFPMEGTASFRNDFREPRDGGAREHLGNDIIASKMTPLVSTVDGIVSYVVRPEARWGYSITIQDEEGYQYRYLHINNDTPGTDDGRGGEEYAYVGGIRRGDEVMAGQRIGFVGDSGNAETTVSHLHFEIRTPSRMPINPYDSLTAAAARSQLSSQIQVGSGATAEHETTGNIGVARGAEFVFTLELHEGMQGEAIRSLQSRLKDGGYFTFYLTNYFGPITKTALEKYQRANNIAPTGVLGFETRALLNRDPRSAGGVLRLKENLFEGMKGEAVQQVQLKLETLGFFSTTVTGVYGSDTREAVRRFQVDKKLSTSGFVDQNTWAKLNEVYAAYDVPAVAISERSLPVPYTFTLPLYIGIKGEEVKMLQKELQGLGYFSSSVSLTGYFGPITKAAVALFQAENGIEAIGIVGPKTRAALNTL